MVKFDEGFSHGFKSDHKVSLLLESPLVFALIPDLFPLVEVMNLVFKITSWNIAVDFGVIVHWIWQMVVVVAMVMLRLRGLRVVVRRLAGVVVGRLNLVVVIMFVVVVIVICLVVIMAAEVSVVMIIVAIIGIVVIMWLVVDDIVV